MRALGSNIGLAFSVGVGEAVRGDWRTVLTDLERLKAVTPADVSRVAGKYLTEENRTVVWLVEEASDGGGEARVSRTSRSSWSGCGRFPPRSRSSS